MDRDGYSVLGVNVHTVDYARVVSAVVEAAHARRPLAVTALAVHGVMTGVLDPVHRCRLNALDVVCPDGQPVRWALALLYGVRLRDRVYGPTLALRVCEAAAREGLSVYLYGTQAATLDAMAANLRGRFPALRIAGMQPSAFRLLTAAEQQATAARIRESGAHIVLCGLGCPRQEVWVYEHRELLPMPTLAVGAAFDFIAGEKPQAPAWMQARGLEWLYRLWQEPRRLWRRYILLNPAYIALFVAQWAGLWRPSGGTGTPPAQRYG